MSKLSANIMGLGNSLLLLGSPFFAKMDSHGSAALLTTGSIHWGWLKDTNMPCPPIQWEKKHHRFLNQSSESSIWFYDIILAEYPTPFGRGSGAPKYQGLPSCSWWAAELHSQHWHSQWPTTGRGKQGDPAISVKISRIHHRDGTWCNHVFAAKMINSKGFMKSKDETEILEVADRSISIVPGIRWISSDNKSWRLTDRHCPRGNPKKKTWMAPLAGCTGMRHSKWCMDDLQ